MRFICKNCSHILTNDLYKSNKLYIEEQSPNTYEQQEASIVFKGSYYHKHSNYKDKLKKHKPADNIYINPDDILDQKQLTFISGQGCCGNSYIDFYCPECSTSLGYQFLDCYESKIVTLIEHKIDFNYKKISYDLVIQHVEFNDRFWNRKMGWVSLDNCELFTKDHIYPNIKKIKGVLRLKSEINIDI